jgi:5'-nucleotidase
MILKFGAGIVLWGRGFGQFRLAESLPEYPEGAVGLDFTGGAEYSGFMNILITNDDGILAPGLLALAGAVRDLGPMAIVAPETAQSAAAHSITLSDPLICTQVELPGGLAGYSVAGRPADCVKLALVELCGQCVPPVRPQIVLSGINAGSNVGINVLYSGTVAAAIEGAFFNLPAVAFSLTIRDKVDFDYAGRIARQVLDVLLAKNAVKPGYVLNVNIPPPECGTPKGIRIVPQSTQCGSTIFDRRFDPRGRLYFWLTGETGRCEEEKDTDVAAMEDHFIAITPLMFDLTDYSRMNELKRLLE